MGDIATGYSDRPVLDGTELIHIVYNGVDYQCTVENLLDLVVGGVGGYTPQTVEDITGTTYTIVDDDMGKLKRITNAAGCTVTVPADATEPGYDEGAHTDFMVGVGAGQLIFVGEGEAATGFYVDLPGVSGAMLTTPDHASITLTSGNLEIVWREKRADYTKDQVICSQWGAETNQGWFLMWLAAGVAYVNVTADGSSDLGIGQSGGNPTLTDNTAYWFRYRWTGATRSWVMQYAADQPTEPLSWTAFSASALGAAITLHNSTAVFAIGSIADGTYANWDTELYDFRLRLSHGGADSLVLSPENWVSGSTYTADTGQVITIAGTASIVGDPGSVIVTLVPPDGYQAASVGEGDRLAVQKVDAGTDQWSVYGRLDVV